MNVRLGYFPHTLRRHPLENQETLSIQQSGLFAEVARLCGSIRNEVSTLPDMILHGYPVTERTYPRLNRIYQSVLKRLDCDQKYDLFVDFSYEIKAKTYGSEKNGHMIVVNSACMEELSDGELAALLGHEIGHIQENHVQTQALLDSMHLLTDRLPFLGSLAEQKLVSYFAKWMISSELTADRYALFASGSVENVINLLLKQAGCSTQKSTVKELLHQDVVEIPDKLGVLFLLMSKNVACYGLVQRAQVITEWVLSPEIQEIAPYAYYCAKNYLELVPQGSEEEALALLHKRAENGNPAAMSALGHAYLLKKRGLPAKPETAVDLLIQASCLGNGYAQYYLSGCAQIGAGGLPKDEALKTHLLSSAASRVPELQLQCGNKSPKAEHVRNIVYAVLQHRSEVSFACDEETISRARDQFWINLDDEIYAAEIHLENQIWVGTAITGSGIYGRICPDSLPYRILWTDLHRKELTKQTHWDCDYLLLDNQKLYRCRNPLPGSLAEIIVMAKSKMEKER